MRDPLYQGDNDDRRLASDPGAMAALWRVHRLKIASGLIALALIAAIWWVWRFG
jgi:hypothetical protein